jgi:hypothetical protein
MAGQDSLFFEVVEQAKKAGWTAEKTNKNHWRFNPPPGINGNRPVFTSGTPGDFRAFQNFLTKMRRAGFNFRKGQ